MAYIGEYPPPPRVIPVPLLSCYLLLVLSHVTCVFPCRYVGPVNFVKGRCPRTMAVNFSCPDSFVLVPDINITDGNFTIAFWIRSLPINSGFVVGEIPIIGGRFVGGNMFLLSLEVINKVVIFYSLNTTYSSEPLPRSAAMPSSTNLNKWNHLAVTCDRDSTTWMFLNGELMQAPSIVFKRTQVSIIATMKYAQKYYIGEVPFQVNAETGHTDATVAILAEYIISMENLHIIRYALSPKEVFDLCRGQRKIFSKFFNKILAMIMIKMIRTRMA